MVDEKPKPKRSDFSTSKKPLKEAFNPAGINQARNNVTTKSNKLSDYNPTGLTNNRNKKK